MLINYVGLEMCAQSRFLIATPYIQKVPCSCFGKWTERRWETYKNSAKTKLFNLYQLTLSKA